MYNPALEIAQQTILEHLPVAILIVDKKGLIHYYNQEADKLFQPGFLNSANITQLSDDLNELFFYKAIDELNSHSAVITFNINFKHCHTNHSYQLKMIINPEDRNLGQKNFYLITLNSILINEEPSAGKEPSASREPSAGKEPSANEKPSANKKTSQLKKNFRELKQFSRLSAMREISSSLADKLNQPLTAILSYTQAMQRLYQSNAPSDEIDKAMKRVVINAENAGQIIKNIRSQLNANTLSCQNTCMNRLIQESIHLTELDSSTSPIKFITHYEPSCISLCIDKVQIRQVIFSLINNAIDAVMEDSVKSPEIILSTRCSDLHYEIVISDNGPGFPEEIQKKLFEPFSTTKKNGIGIGLSMCHHIIDLHKGSINIISDNSSKKELTGTQPATIVTISLPLNSNKISSC